MSARVIREYEGLAKIFQFLKVDARQSIYEQHRQIRQMFMVGHRKPWAECNEQAILTWLNSGDKNDECRNRGRKAGKAKVRRRSASSTADQPPPAGRLIALDGTRGPRPGRGGAAKSSSCSKASRPRDLSRFDSSNTFFELRMAKGKRGLRLRRRWSCLYASDLLFRLRWEIRPALAEGRTVVVAPYVQTVIGFGLAAGLSREWLEELFAFAPPPDGALRLKEKRKGKDKESKGANGYFDFCCWSLSGISAKWTASDLRGRILAHFDELEEQGKL